LILRNISYVRSIHALAVASVACVSNAETLLAPIFTDHMVFQRDMNLPVWGSGNPGEHVVVEFNGTTVATTVEKDGKWHVVLPPQIASKTARELKILASGKEQLIVQDVIVGEVWLCAGQSNMEFRCAQEATWATEKLASSHPEIRLHNMAYAGQGIGAKPYTADIVARQTAERFYDASSWAAVDAKSAAPFSAVGYFFGKELRAVLDVPVGIINMSVGGSSAESWIRREALPSTLTAPDWTANNTHLEPWCNTRALAQLGALRDAAPGGETGPNHAFKPAFLWDAGPARLAPFAIRGVLWYQGESNALSHMDSLNPKWRIDQHAKLFPTLVSDWRKQWRQGDFPFLVCQLSSLDQPTREFWPDFRDSQRRMLAEIANLGLAVTSDIGNRSDVHPKNKHDVGKRLARWALRYTYGEMTALPCPIPVTATRAGSTVNITFQHAGPVLSTSDGSTPASLELAGVDGVFHPATAEIAGSTLRVKSAAIAEPHAVRYGWQPFSKGNLTNAEGLPASTFLLNVVP
jgi:sialate O-acetylesterase